MKISRRLQGTGDEPLSIYFLEIVSPVELTVTAVYTAHDLRGMSVALDVVQVEANEIKKSRAWARCRWIT